MNDQVVNILKSGGIGVFATDTLYGLVGSALNKESVERLYKVRKRDTQKPMIILISKIEDLEIFHINLEPKIKDFLERLWPARVSVILECKEKEFKYLHRGTNSLAFRVPDKVGLKELLEKTGPLVAPSANLEGEKESKNIEEAKAYFGGSVDFYEDEGILEGKASTLIRIKNNKVEVLREGAQAIPNLE